MCHSMKSHLPRLPSFCMHITGATRVMQALIGGGDHQGLDLEDMKQHVNYAGGYDTDHPVIMEFWRVRCCPSAISCV